MLEDDGISIFCAAPPHMQLYTMKNERVSLSFFIYFSSFNTYTSRASNESACLLESSNKWRRDLDGRERLSQGR